MVFFLLICGIAESRVVWRDRGHGPGAGPHMACRTWAHTVSLEDRVGSLTDVLTSRFGLPVLAVASIDTVGGDGGEGSVPDTCGGPETQEAVHQAAYDLYEMANHDVPPVKSEAELDASATKRAKALRKLADGLERGITAKKRAALRNRAEQIRVAAERLVFGVHNWELDDEDKRWHAEQAKKAGPDANRKTD